MQDAQKPNIKSGKKSKVVIALIIIVLLIGIGVTLMIQEASKEHLTAGQQKLVDFVNSTQDYPDSYINADLPQYPSGNVTSLNEKTLTPENIISIVLTSKDSSEKIAKYYDDNLVSNGWTPVIIGERKPFDAMPYNQDYQKDNQSYSLIIQTSQQKSGENDVLISWLEDTP